MFLARFEKRFAMDCDEFGQGIRSLSAFAHVVIIESLDVPNLGQTLLPVLHPGMRRRRTGTRSEQDQRFHADDRRSPLYRRHPYCTVTSVPTGSSEKNLRAASSGNRMQPCDAG